ncbi:MAG: hypothetical protein U5K76_13930 [Woeseiaceae bacterium]|nr:hypothetical protein [Woeseiaceae bacterium]
MFSVTRHLATRYRPFPQVASQQGVDEALEFRRTQQAGRLDGLRHGRMRLDARVLKLCDADCQQVADQRIAARQRALEQHGRRRAQAEMVAQGFEAEMPEERPGRGGYAIFGRRQRRIQANAPRLPPHARRARPVPAA